MTTVGVVGGGQLARMLHQAAISLDVEVVVLDPDVRCPAVLAGAGHVAGTWTSVQDLARFARCGVDVVTFDHELTDPADMLVLQDESPVPVRPSASTKLLAQDKLHARTTFAGMGLAVPAFATVRTSVEIDVFAAEHGWPVVLKAPRGGYDGRGVWIVCTPDEAAAVLDGADGDAMLAEELVEIDHELAVMVARRPSGDVRAWPPMETVQVDGICTEVAISPATERTELARALAVELAERIDLAGVMAVELFVLRDGRLVINEIACRPHNSGHVTMGSCVVDQFEQHLRAVLDLPLGRPELIVDAAVMANLLGGAEAWTPDGLATALEVEDAKLHLYGKAHRPGRKLGHVNAVGTSVGEARDRAQQVLAALSVAS